MKKYQVTTTAKKMLADLYTPVGIYLRLRDRFRDTILLESADSQAGKQSYSFIGINAIAGLEVKNGRDVEIKYPAEEAVKQPFGATNNIASLIASFMEKFSFNAVQKPVNGAQALFGYTSHEAIQLYEPVRFKFGDPIDSPLIPLIRYRFYQYVIIINHFKNELFICENEIRGIESQLDSVESAIRGRDVAQYPFQVTGEEKSGMSDEEFLKIVATGIEKCKEGEVSQIVLSRGYSRQFTGDEFNVYRALRNINPSPYMFYFDYGDYRLMGSSPESQVIVKDGAATIHPIAGTFRRSGVDAEDQRIAKALTEDEKEREEHDMLVDLAVEELQKSCEEVRVSNYCQVQFFSHVIHLVSEVTGKIRDDVNPVSLIYSTFPAGTLSGAPKMRALELIDELERNSRSYYGGSIGSIGFDGNITHAITIRTFLSMNNQLFYRAGAGVTAKSVAEKELGEVHNKLNALVQSLRQAETTKNENIVMAAV